MLTQPKIKAVFFDLDGTLVSFKTHTVPLSAQKALRQAQQQGVLLFVATGRHTQEMEQIDSLDLSLFSGFVTQNGQYCYTPQKVLLRQPLPKAEVEALLACLQVAPAACLFCTEKDIFVNFVNRQVERTHAAISTQIPAVGAPARARQEDIYQLVIYGDTAFAQPYLACLPGCVGTCSNGCAVDIVPKGGGKEKGIACLAAAFGLKQAEIMVLGDGDNDVGMMGWAGLAVAMGNGAPDAKQAAHAVCPGVDEDGVAAALAQYVLPG